jgi:hypothetical protein
MKGDLKVLCTLVNHVNSQSVSLSSIGILHGKQK